MNVLALTAYRRPELVKIYFEQLLKDKDELSKYLVHLFLDYGFHPDIYKVISWFKQYHRNIKLTIRTQEESKKSPLPAFFNIMDSYRAAAEKADDFVVIGEEDIIPTSDYLRFNRICYEQFLSRYPKIFCVAHKRRPETELQGDPSVLIGDIQITSPSCISVKTINNYILPRLNNPLFYSNPIHYNQTHFLTSKNKPDHHIHHDGQIERIAEAEGMFSLKPDQARSMHIGVGSMHGTASEYKIEGTLQEKVDKYYNLIKLGSSELRKYVTQFKEDIVVAPLDIAPWTNLELDLNRNKAKASSWWYDQDNEFKTYINSILLDINKIK